MQDWKSGEQKLYFPSPEPNALHVPPQFYFVIDGKGHSGSADFNARHQVLAALSETVRTIDSYGYRPPGFTPSTAYPLELLCQPGPENEPPSFSLMMRQPDFIDNKTIDLAFTVLHTKRQYPLLPEVAFEQFTDGFSAQLLSSKDKAAKRAAFSELEQFLLVTGCQQRSRQYREIHLGDATGNSDAVVYRVFIEEAD